MRRSKYWSVRVSSKGLIVMTSVQKKCNVQFCSFGVRKLRRTISDLFPFRSATPIPSSHKSCLQTKKDDYICKKRNKQKNDGRKNCTLYRAGAWAFFATRHRVKTGTFDRNFYSAKKKKKNVCVISATLLNKFLRILFACRDVNSGYFDFDSAMLFSLFENQL